MPYLRQVVAGEDCRTIVPLAVYDAGLCQGRYAVPCSLRFVNSLMINYAGGIRAPPYNKAGFSPYANLHLLITSICDHFSPPLSPEATTNFR